MSTWTRPRKVVQIFELFQLFKWEADSYICQHHFISYSNVKLQTAIFEQFTCIFAKHHRLHFLSKYSNSSWLWYLNILCSDISKAHLCLYAIVPISKCQAWTACQYLKQAYIFDPSEMPSPFNSFFFYGTNHWKHNVMKYCISHYFRVQLFSRFWTRCGNWRGVNFAILLMLSLL